MKQTGQVQTNMAQDRFEIFVDHTIDWETGGDLKHGGYTNDPDDPGGRTRWGISKGGNPKVNIKQLTLEGAKEIYRNKYYHSLYDYIDSSRIAFKVFDMNVLMGKRAVKLLQQTIVKDFGITIAKDSLFGPMTLSGLNYALYEYGEGKVYDAYVRRLKNRLTRITWITPTSRKYLKGWLRRVDLLPREVMSIKAKKLRLPSPKQKALQNLAPATVAK